MLPGNGADHPQPADRRRDSGRLLPLPSPDLQDFAYQVPGMLAIVAVLAGTAIPALPTRAPGCSSPPALRSRRTETGHGSSSPAHTAWAIPLDRRRVLSDRAGAVRRRHRLDGPRADPRRRPRRHGRRSDRCRRHRPGQLDLPDGADRRRPRGRLRRDRVRPRLPAARHPPARRPRAHPLAPGPGCRRSRCSWALSWRFLLSDFPYAIVALSDGYYTGHIVEAGWLAASVLWSAAALHPSMRKVAEPVDAGEIRMSAWRLALLAAASLMAPAVLVIQWSGQPDRRAGHRRRQCRADLLVIARLSGVVSDLRSTLTHRQRLEKELESRALHDPLTGLANRSSSRSPGARARPTGRAGGRAVPGPG